MVVDDSRLKQQIQPWCPALYGLQARSQLEEPGCLWVFNFFSSSIPSLKRTVSLPWKFKGWEDDWFWFPFGVACLFQVKFPNCLFQGPPRDPSLAFWEGNPNVTMPKLGGDNLNPLRYRWAVPILTEPVDQLIYLWGGVESFVDFLDAETWGLR